ncbi:MAG: hypothetical protein DWQ06_14650 [Calditrichaeota bacterium]|nr:MAG: hypothetical protein DWQ06_14650 [Calditrichota bacterium]
MVISSIVMNCYPPFYESVKEQIKLIPEAEIVFTKESKLAVVLETETTDLAAGIAEEIRVMVGVLSLELVAHFFEDEVIGDSKDLYEKVIEESHKNTFLEVQK